MAHAFISYTHIDAHYTERLHVHLAQLKRESLLTSWYDGEIAAGQQIERAIDQELKIADLFLALVSPDYLASNYCYNIEFQQAQQLHEAAKLVIIPIIVQPCDWKSSPFGKFKAIPKDGKPVSEWTNENNAFLNIVDEIRKLIKTTTPSDVVAAPAAGSMTRRNYRVQTDFDAVDKLNFKEKAFATIHDYFKAAIAEINGIDNIKARFVRESLGEQFTCVITNRAKINTDGYISIGIIQQDHFGRNGINFALAEQLNSNFMGNNYALSHDEYEMFWIRNELMYGSRNDNQKLTAKEIAAQLWEAFIAQVGIS